MNKIILLAVFLVGFMSNAQTDKIYKHSGEVVEGKVKRVEEYTIVFVYDGEEAENTIGKYAIERIVYGSSGREEEVTEKIVINSEKDWEKVVILEDKAYIAGLKKAGEVRGKTGLINFQTGNFIFTETMGNVNRDIYGKNTSKDEAYLTMGTCSKF